MGNSTCMRYIPRWLIVPLLSDKEALHNTGRHAQILHKMYQLLNRPKWPGPFFRFNKDRPVDPSQEEKYGWCLCFVHILTYFIDWENGALDRITKII